MRASDLYRQHAQEAIEQAERCISPSDKAAWLRIAQQWLKLAEDTERDGR